MKLAELFTKPLHVLTSRRNVVLIQLHPKERVVTLSYKGEIKRGKFAGNEIKNMLKGGRDFYPNAEEVIGAIAKLLEQLITKK